MKRSSRATPRPACATFAAPRSCLCGDWHHADDVVQTVFTKLYVNWEKVQRHDRLDGYVRTMLVRATFDRRRRIVVAARN